MHIYIYSYPQTDYFAVSQICVARPERCFKLRLKLS